MLHNLGSLLSKIVFVAFTRTENGEYVLLGGKAKFWHYCAIVILLAICIQKTWATVQVFLYQAIRLESFMSLTVDMIYVANGIMGIAVLTKPKEMVDVLNSWPHIAVSLKRMGATWEFHPLKNKSACFKTICGIYAGQGCAIALVIIYLVFSDLPVFFLPTVEALSGFSLGSILPNWAWKIMFVPIEYFTVQPLILLGSISGCGPSMQIGALDIFLQQLRGIEVRSMTSRRRVERMYVELELFNRITQVWIKSYFPFWLLGLSGGVIMGVFVTIRYTQLPLIFYVFFPYVGFNLLVLIFWQCYDMLRVIRASEDILGVLCQHHAPYFQGIDRAKRIEVMKRSKAMRPLGFPVADSQFSINLPIGVWEENVNQILFLLSL